MKEPLPSGVSALDNVCKSCGCVTGLRRWTGRGLQISLPILLSGAMAAMFPGTACAAAPCSDQPVAIEENKITLGPQHHPIGRPLPSTPEFNQPDRCADTIWFFDKNRNGRHEPGEVRVFGVKRQVDCASCHGESAESKSAASASVFLRQDAADLCLVCHKL